MCPSLENNIKYLNAPKNMKILQWPQIVAISSKNNFQGHHFFILEITTFQGL